MLRDALFYALELGWPVFPVRGKRPLPRTHGFKDATTDEATIRGWFTRWGGLGIATALGDGRCVIDVDAPDDVPQWLAAHLDHHTGPRCQSGRGYHCYYAADPELRTRRLIPGVVDLKAAGGYVLLPPTWHSTGRRYRWDRGPEHPMELLPDDVAARAAPRPVPTGPVVVRAVSPYVHRVVNQAVDSVAAALPGARNETLNRAAYTLGRLAGGGLFDPGVARDLAIGAGVAAGLDPDEVVRTVDSGLHAGMARPMRVVSR